MRRNITCFDSRDFHTNLKCNSSILTPPLTVVCLAGHRRYLFAGDSEGRVHLLGPGSLDLNTDAVIVQEVLHSIKLFSQPCHILHMEVIDSPNSSGVGYTNFLFVLCSVETVKEPTLGFHVYEILPPLTSLYLIQGQPSVHPALRQPLVMLREAFIADSTGLIEGLSSRPILPGSMNTEMDITRKALSQSTCVSVCACLKLVAIGSNQGDTVLIRGDLRRPDTQIRLRRVPSSGVPVTCVCLREVDDRACLFIATTLSISCYEVLHSIKDDSLPPTMLWQESKFGCPQNCLAWLPSLNGCVAASFGGLFVFDPTQGNISAIPIDEVIVSLQTVDKNQLAISMATEVDRRSGVASVTRTPNLLLDRSKQGILGSNVISLLKPNLLQILYVAGSLKFDACATTFPKAFTCVAALGHLAVLHSDLIIDSQKIEGTWLIEHSLAERVCRLARRGWPRWAIQIARESDTEGYVAKSINRFAFHSALNTDLFEAINLFESSIRDDRPNTMLSFEDFIRGILSGAGNVIVWRQAIQVMLRCLVLFHLRGLATPWHTKLLIESLKIYQTHCPEDLTLLCRSNDYVSDYAREVASLIPKSKGEIGVNLLTVAAMLELKADMSDCPKLAASLALICGDLPTWTKLTADFDPKIASIGLKAICLMNPELAALCVKALHLPIPSCIMQCLMECRSLLNVQDLNKVMFKSWIRTEIDNLISATTDVSTKTADVSTKTDASSFLIDEKCLSEKERECWN